MCRDKEIKELEKYWRHSRAAIPVHAGMLVAAAGVLWLLPRSLFIPVVIMAVVVGVTALALIGDVINCLYCARKLRTLGHEQRE